MLGLPEQAHSWNFAEPSVVPVCLCLHTPCLKSHRDDRSRGPEQRRITKLKSCQLPLLWTLTAIDRQCQSKTNHDKLVEVSNTVCMETSTLNIPRIIRNSIRYPTNTLASLKSSGQGPPLTPSCTKSSCFLAQRHQAHKKPSSSSWNVNPVSSCTPAH